MEAAKLRSKDIWQKALDTLRSTWRQTLFIMTAGLVLPQLLADLWFDTLGAQAAQRMRGLFESHDGVKTAFWDLIEPVLSFAAPFFVGSLLVLVVTATAYFALVNLAVQHMRDGEQLTIREALLRGLAATARRLPGLLFVVIVLTFVGQVFVLPAIIASVLGLAAPVIAVADHKGSFRAALDAITVQYARRSAYGPWAVSFNMLSLGATFYFGVMVVALGIEQLLMLDQSIPALRPFWSQQLGNLAFGPIYLLASLAESVLLMALVAIIPVTTTALYFTVAARREIARV